MKTKTIGESINRCAFFGFFTELSFSKLIPSGFGFEEGMKVLVEENKRVLSPGILIGKNLLLSKKCFLDVYSGIKYRFTSQESIFSENQSDKIEKSMFGKIGARVGINFNYLF